MMKTVFALLLVVTIGLLAGCSAGRKNMAVVKESSAAAVEQQQPETQLPDVAPIGNAALAGKPEGDEAAGHIWDFRDATTWLLGEVSPGMLNNPPHSEWYHKGYADYQPDQEVMAELMEIEKDELTITIVIGTWCPDSRREVPRFVKMADLWGFPQERIKYIGVDINKVAPLEDYFQLAIERVPTFIFYKKNIEKGRIIEVPETSLEQDTRNILKGN